MKNSIRKAGGRKRRIYFAAILFLLGCSLFLGQGSAPERETDACLWDEMMMEVQEKAYRTYFPVFSFLERETGKEEDTAYIMELFEGFFPLYEYAQRRFLAPAQTESRGILEQIMAGEENGGAESGKGTGTESGNGIDMDAAASAGAAEADASDALRKGNGNADAGAGDLSAASQTEFVEAEKALSVDREALQDFDTLVSEFYTVDSTTYIGRDQLDIGRLTEKDMTLKQTDASRPQILIYHTHSQEGFADSVEGDDMTTVMGAGERLAQLLREKYGFNVIHHMGKYDVESRDYAYSNAAPALEELLTENPDIEVVIDLHRDEVPQERRLVTDIGGRSTAQFMFFNGLSRTNKTGEIDYLENPNLDENLAFSFQMQLASNEYYPGITRKIYLKGYRYNMHYRGKTLLIELGAQNNTVEEIMNACGPLAHVLYLVLSGEA